MQANIGEDVDWSERQYFLYFGFQKIFAGYGKAIFF